MKAEQSKKNSYQKNKPFIQEFESTDLFKAYRSLRILIHKKKKNNYNTEKEIRTLEHIQKLLKEVVITERKKVRRDFLINNVKSDSNKSNDLLDEEISYLIKLKALNNAIIEDSLGNKPNEEMYLLRKHHKSIKRQQKLTKNADNVGFSDKSVTDRGKIIY